MAPLPPLPHQAEVLAHSKDLPAFAILWEMGLGKTRTAIDTAVHLYNEGKIDAVMVVAPNGVHRNWITDELPKHLPPSLQNTSDFFAWESAKAATKRHQAAAETCLKHQGLAWFLISYDGVMTARGKLFASRFLKQRRVLYILDESHSVKTPGAKRTKAIVASAKWAPYRRILSGTPVSQGPFDLYSQLRFIDPDVWKRHGLGSYHIFKQFFGVWYTRQQARAQNGYDPGFDRLIAYQNLDRLQEILASVSSRLTKDDHLDLPPKVHTKRYFDLSPEQARLYSSLKSDLLVQLADPLSGEMVDGSLALTLLLRLQQITSGFVGTETLEGEVHLRDIPGPNPRLSLLTDICEELTRPAIIWARFTRDIDLIMAALGPDAVRYDGRVTDDEAAEAKRKFQAGEAKFFVGNAQKGGMGLTLTQAKTVIYYSNSFRLVDRLQSEDRAHRIGQKDSVTYIDLVAPHTVDEHIVKALREKFDIAGQITGDKLKEWI